MAKVVQACCPMQVHARKVPRATAAFCPPAPATLRRVAVNVVPWPVAG